MEPPQTAIPKPPVTVVDPTPGASLEKDPMILTPSQSAKPSSKPDVPLTMSDFPMTISPGLHFSVWGLCPHHLDDGLGGMKPLKVYTRSIHPFPSGAILHVPQEQLETIEKHTILPVEMLPCLPTLFSNDYPST